jgi:hypothetical protein
LIGLGRRLRGRVFSHLAGDLGKVSWIAEILVDAGEPYVGDMVADVLDGLKENGLENNGAVESLVNERVRELCARFPIYQG